MRKLLWLTTLVSLMVLFGAYEGDTVFGIGSAQARVGRPLTPGSVAGVARRSNRRAYRHGAYGGLYIGPGGVAITPDYPHYGPGYGPGRWRRW